MRERALPAKGLFWRGNLAAEGDRAADMRERAQRRVRLQGPDAPNVGALGQLGGTGGANKPRWSLLTCQLQTAVGKRAAALGGQTGVVQIDFFYMWLPGIG